MALNDVITSIQNHTREIYDALEDKNAIIPENKNLANVPDSIRSIEENGLDTSDATAIADDIAKGKTAYANGEKIEGTLLDLRRDTDATTFLGASENISYTESTSNGWLQCTITPADPLIINEHNLILAEISRSVAAREIGLTADKIVSGNTILGIEGTAISGNGDIKTFNSIAEMNASTGNEAGDLAVVYKESTGHLEGNDAITAWTFPATVVLDEAYTGNAASGLYWFDPFISDSYYCTLTPTSARFEMNGSGIVFNARYTSTDGITYTLVSGGGDVVLPEGVTMSLARDSIDTNGSIYHFFTEPQYVELEKMLEGVYEYTSANKWELLILSTSNATATAENIEKDKTAYVNGKLITGTLDVINSGTTRASSVNYIDWGGEPGLEAIVNTENPTIVKEGYGIFTPEETIARMYAVTPNQIVAGNTILGVEGTATCGDGNINIKTFNSIEEMNNSTGNQAGDYALIYQYDKDINNLDFGHYITSWTFPKVVTLDSSITKDFFCSVNTDEGDQDFTSVAASLQGDRTSISFYYKATGLNNVVEISQEYTSQDGKTFTSSKNDDFYVELPGTMSISIESNGDYDNQYLQIFKSIAYKDAEDRFTNLYQYDGTTWNLISLDTSDATATSNDIAQGKIAYVNGKEIIGGVETVNTSMSQGVADIIPISNFLYFESTFYTPTLFAKGTKYSIQQPYANVANAINLTSDKIVEGNTVLGIAGTATSGTNTSDATAAASDIMLGKTAYVKGQKVTGTVTYRDYDNYSDDSNLKIELEQDSQRLDGEPYVSFYNHNMSGYIYNRVNFNKRYSEVAAAIGLTADKIATGNTILGIAGTATTGDGIDTSDATAYDWHLPEGITAYARGEKITGTMPVQSDTRYMYEAFSFVGDDFVLYAQTDPNNYTLFGAGRYIGVQIEPETLATAINLTADKLAQGSTVLGVEGIAVTNGIDTSAATATENDLALGKTAYVNGQLIEGALYDMPAGEWIAWSNIRNTYQNGVLTLFSAIDGDTIFRQNSEVGSSIRDNEMATLFGVTADKIVSGNTILGITGTATEGLDTSDATAIDNDILAGKTAYVNGELVTGTLVDRSNRGCGYQGGITIKEDGNLFTMQEVVSTAYREIFHNTIVSFTADVEDVAEAIGLTADKIAQGNTILGIAGGAAVFSEYAPRYISFQGYTGTGLKSELDALNTSNIEDMSEMFKDCSNITELDLNNFDTSKVTDMSNMFSGCSNLEILDISSFDVSNVSTATGMFDSIPSDCIIWVKDEATREWVLSIRSDLTNVLVTGEALPSATNPILTSVNKEYDGTALIIAVAGGSGGTIYYRTSEDNDTWSAWATTKPTRTAIGVTYVQAYVKGDSTHSDTLPTESATITIKEVPKTSIAVPTAKTNLKYTGSAQTGVAAGTGYTLSGTTSATNAGTYTAYATPNLNYIWNDGTSDKKTITWSISKATPTISIDQGWAPDVYIGSSQTLGIEPSVSGTWTISSSSSALSLTSKPTSATAGSYSYLTYKGVSEKSSVTITVTLNPSNTTNYNSVTETYEVSVDGIYPDDLTVVTTGRTTYTASEIGGSSFSLDGYTFRVDYNNGTSKNVSSSQCTYGYTWSPGKSSVPVTVYYEENGETVTTSVTITINPSS